MKRLVLLTITILLATALAGCTSCIGADTSEAEGYAKTFVAKNFPGQQVVNIECQNADSDGNGYVSCTASVKDAKGNTVLHPLECVATYFWQGRWAMSGCRTPKVGQ